LKDLNLWVFWVNLSGKMACFLNCQQTFWLGSRGVWVWVWVWVQTLDPNQKPKPKDPNIFRSRPKMVNFTEKNVQFQCFICFSFSKRFQWIFQSFNHTRNMYFGFRFFVWANKKGVIFCKDFFHVKTKAYTVPGNRPFLHELTKNNVI